MIIWLASYPRSGNTFFRMLLNQLYGFKSYSVYDDPDIVGMGAANVVGHERMPYALEELREDSKIYFVKTHEHPSGSDPAIYLVRDGRDALVSHARYLKEFYWGTNDPIRRVKQIIGFENFNRTLRNVILTSRWNEHVMAWSHRQKKALTYTIRYEDLVKNPEFYLAESLKTVGVGDRRSAEHNMPSFDDLKSQFPKFFRKGKIGSWQQEMPVNLQKLFWDHHAEAMNFFYYGKDT